MTEKGHKNTRWKRKVEKQMDEWGQMLCKENTREKMHEKYYTDENFVFMYTWWGTVDVSFSNCAGCEHEFCNVHWN